MLQLFQTDVGWMYKIDADSDILGPFSTPGAALAAIISQSTLVTTLSGAVLPLALSVDASKTDSFNVVANKVYSVGTTAGAINATLPASPVAGDWVVINGGPSATANDVNILRNGKTINGAAADGLIDTNYAIWRAVYDGTGWVTF